MRSNHYLHALVVGKKWKLYFLPNMPPYHQSELAVVCAAQVKEDDFSLVWASTKVLALKLYSDSRCAKDNIASSD